MWTNRMWMSAKRMAISCGETAMFFLQRPESMSTKALGSLERLGSEPEVEVIPASM